jgi:hypothetical protein
MFVNHSIIWADGIGSIDDIIVYLIRQTTNEQAQQLGKKHGMLMTDRGRKILGKDWENVEDIVQQRIENYNYGVHILGLNYDDKED